MLRLFNFAYLIKFKAFLTTSILLLTNWGLKWYDNDSSFMVYLIVHFKQIPYSAFTTHLFFLQYKQTSRERHKSAPYLRLKVPKVLQTFEIFHCTQKPKSWTELARLRPLATEGTLWDFWTFLSQNIKKIERVTIWCLWKFFFLFEHRKKTERGPLDLARYCLLRGKKEKPFWFDSLGQMIQFDTIKFVRSFRNYFGETKPSELSSNNENFLNYGT